MKRLAIAAASVLLMLGTAQAQTRAPLYGELGYSFLEFKGDGASMLLKFAKTKQALDRAAAPRASGATLRQ